MSTFQSAAAQAGRNTVPVPAFIVRVKRWLTHRGIRVLLAVYAALLWIAGRVGRNQRPLDGNPLEVLLTGTFSSDNWILAHVRPLAMSDRCARVRFVATNPVPAVDKVEAIYPPAWLVRIVGSVPARLATFFWVGLRSQPDVVGGFHLQFNAMAAAMVARLIGSRSAYFCVGGPLEVLGGGFGCENRLFEKLEVPDAIIERRLHRAVADCDLVITMGTSAQQYFRQLGVRSAIHVVSGGIEPPLPSAGGDNRATDIVFVGRLSPIKRLDLLLEAVHAARRALPSITATIVGDGVMRARLEELAGELELGQNVRFVGHQTNISNWLNTAKLFVLTSDSEGLSLALMEAMMYGLPAVVSHVGDLADLVEEGVNGFLVRERSGEAFAARIVELLANPERLRRFSQAARHSAVAHETARMVQRWNWILTFPESQVSAEQDESLLGERGAAAARCAPRHQGVE